MQEECQIINETEREEFEKLKNQIPEDNFKVLVGDEAEQLTATLDERAKNPIQLPPQPDGILPWAKDEEKGYLYSLSDLPKDAIDKRLQFKMFNIWNLWGLYRNNEKLIELLNKIPEDRTSEDFAVKCGLVVLIDRLGKILNGGTDIIEEFKPFNL